MSDDISDDDAARLGCAGFSLGCLLAPLVLFALLIGSVVLMLFSRTGY